jgi:hypothetical protein
LCAFEFISRCCVCFVFSSFHYSNFVFFIAAITYLVFTEVGYNFKTIITERVHVNATSPVGLDVEFDISLPQVPCSLLNIDANDPTGQTQSLHLDLKHHVWKHRIKVNDNGKIEFVGKRSKLEQGSTLLQEEHLKAELEKLIKEKADDGDDDDDASSEEEEDGCGSCYGAGEEGECCNTCDDVKRAYNRKGWHLQDASSVAQCKHDGGVKEDEGEGCNVHGVVALDTGGGNFHVAPGRNVDNMAQQGGMGNILDMLMRTFQQWNVSHTIHKLQFGEAYPGHVHQLDGETRNIVDSYGMYQYYFKVKTSSIRSCCRYYSWRGDFLTSPFSVSFSLPDCTNPLSISQWYIHSNQSIQCDRTSKTCQPRRGTRFAWRLFLL